jgi:hypothetical protein
LGDSASTRTCLLDSAVQQAADLGGRVDTSWRCEARSRRVFRWPTRRHGGAVKRRGDRGWTVRGGSTPARAFQRPHRAHRRTNSPTKCESSTDTSNATGTGVQTLVAATIEMSSMRGRWWIGVRKPSASFGFSASRGCESRVPRIARQLTAAPRGASDRESRSGSGRSLAWQESHAPASGVIQKVPNPDLNDCSSAMRALQRSGPTHC